VSEGAIKSAEPAGFSSPEPDLGIPLSISVAELETMPPTRRELVARIAALALEGCRPAAIARRLAIPRERVLKIAAQFRIRLPRGAGKHPSKRNGDVSSGLAPLR
jgi:hypothetical protein